MQKNKAILGSDAGMLKPILDAIDDFEEDSESLEQFYRIVDKFCVQWFGKPALVADFDTVDLLLIQDMLGEYLAFEGNNRKIALWLLSINRVCYNFTADLSEAAEEIEQLREEYDEEPDTSLIEPIIGHLKQLESQHLNAGIDNIGREDSIGNFLQWVGLYATFIYPSLDNKADFFDKSVLKAMNYLLTEFIKQKSNDKRLAFLIMAIMEACKQYSVANIDVNPQFVDDYAKNVEGEPVLAGTEEDLVQQLLSSLHNETVRQRKEHPSHSVQNESSEKNSPAKQNKYDADIKPASKKSAADTSAKSKDKSKVKGMLSEPFSKDEFDDFIDSLNADSVECVSVFNKFSTDLAAQFVRLDTGKQFIFLQTLSRYRKDCRGSLDKDVWDNLRKSVSLLSPKTIDWLKTELQRLAERKDLYIEYILQKIRSESEATKANTAKLFVMLYLIKKLELL
ncbi:MAG: hypothetical protein II707_01840 [Spirochaetales bacterium]|nr:hypothetical protein [Spirochaetales bacterium]